LFIQVSGVPIEIHGQNVSFEQMACHFGPKLSDGPMMKESNIQNVGQQMMRLVERVLHHYPTKKTFFKK
jgi:hypothetical protein